MKFHEGLTDGGGYEHRSAIEIKSDIEKCHSEGDFRGRRSAANENFLQAQRILDRLRKI